MTINLTVKLNKDDVKILTDRLAVKVTSKSRYDKILFRTIALLIFILYILTPLQWLYLHFETQVSSTLAAWILALLLLLLILLKIWLKQYTNQTNQANKQLFTPIEYIFGKDDIETMMNDFGYLSRYPYASLPATEEAKEHFFVYVFDSSALILPKRCFESDTQIKDWRDHMTAQNLEIKSV